MIEERSAVFDHLTEDSLDWLLSQSGIVMEVADKLPAERPHIIDVFLNGLRCERRCSESFEKRPEQGQQLFSRQ